MTLDVKDFNQPKESNQFREKLQIKFPNVTDRFMHIITIYYKLFLFRKRIIYKNKKL